MIDQQALERIESAASYANAHPRSVRRHEGTTEELAAWASGNVLLSAEATGDRPVFAVWADYGPDAEPAEEARLVAMTGNGPTSEANAHLVALLEPEVVLELVRGYRGFLQCVETRDTPAVAAGRHAESSEERTA